MERTRRLPKDGLPVAVSGLTVMGIALRSPKLTAEGNHRRLLTTSNRGHLVEDEICLQSRPAGIAAGVPANPFAMTKPASFAPGTDWTKILSDPEIASHLGELLRAYREAPPAQRDQALLEAMRKIKGGSGTGKAGALRSSADQSVPVPMPTAHPAPPPFEPDIFTPSWGEDRRRYPRLKCFAAVELRIEGSSAPVWGNLANTSMGGCFVETATQLQTGEQLELGLWVANGKIWVKGMILSGVITQSRPAFGVRVKFAELGAAERETLRQFLKVVESAAKGYHYEHGYLAQLKR